MKKRIDIVQAKISAKQEIFPIGTIAIHFGAQRIVAALVGRLTDFSDSLLFGQFQDTPGGLVDRNKRKKKVKVHNHTH